MTLDCIIIIIIKTLSCKSFNFIWKFLIPSSAVKMQNYFIFNTFPMLNFLQKSKKTFITVNIFIEIFFVNVSAKEAYKQRNCFKTLRNIKENATICFGIFTLSTSAYCIRIRFLNFINLSLHHNYRIYAYKTMKHLICCSLTTSTSSLTVHNWRRSYSFIVVLMWAGLKLANKRCKTAAQTNPKINSQANCV